MLARPRPTLSWCAISVQLALSCPVPSDKIQPSGGPAYLSRCSPADQGSEKWTIKIDVELGPGKYWDNNKGFILPTPERGFWLKSLQIMIADKMETELFMWPPLHLHHMTCRTPWSDPWYDQAVFNHEEVMFSMAGAAFMNRHTQSYDVLNASDGWAKYYPADTIVKCGIRVDDDRLHGEPRCYSVLIVLQVVVDVDRHLDFQPLGSLYWEGTPNGEIGYNLPNGSHSVLSTEYRAPKAGSYHPASFDSHTHPGGKRMELIAKRLHGQEFAEPRLLLTLEHSSMIVEPGPESESLNVKPGIYMRRPTLVWSKMGTSWLRGNLTLLGFSLEIPCYFQAGDIFYTRSIFEIKQGMKNMMMALHGRVLWSEPVQEAALATLPRPVKDWRFHYSGIIRTQLWSSEVPVPYDLLAKVPQMVNESVLLSLHERMPLFFGHPQVTGFTRECLIRINSWVLTHAFSAKDIDESSLLGWQQRECGRN